MTREQLARSDNPCQVADHNRQAARAALTLLVEWEERVEKCKSSPVSLWLSAGPSVVDDHD